jgi:hypothetical protein
MANRRALVKQQIAELEQRVAALQAAAVSHSRCHRALLLRESLLTAWCDGLSRLHEHMLASSADATGDAYALAELLQQERERMQELRTCSKGLSSRHKLSEPQGAARVRTIAPASDPMALFWQHMNTSFTSASNSTTAWWATCSASASCCKRTPSAPPRWRLPRLRRRLLPLLLLAVRATAPAAPRPWRQRTLATLTSLSAAGTAAPRRPRQSILT